jgi:hypothetical protein
VKVEIDVKRESRFAYHVSLLLPLLAFCSAIAGGLWD